MKVDGHQGTNMPEKWKDQRQQSQRHLPPSSDAPPSSGPS